VGTVHTKAIAPLHLRSTTQSLFFCLYYGVGPGISGLAGGFLYEKLGMRWVPCGMSWSGWGGVQQGGAVWLAAGTLHSASRACSGVPCCGGLVHSTGVHPPRLPLNPIMCHTYS